MDDWSAAVMLSTVGGGAVLIAVAADDGAAPPLLLPFAMDLNGAGVFDWRNVVNAGPDATNPELLFAPHTAGGAALKPLPPPLL